MTKRALQAALKKAIRLFIREWCKRGDEQDVRAEVDAIAAEAYDAEVHYTRRR